MYQIGILRLPRIFLGWFAFAFCVSALDGCAGQVAKIPPPLSPPSGQSVLLLVGVDTNHVVVGTMTRQPL